MSETDQGVSLGTKNPLIGVDVERLEREMHTYHQWLDERADDAYRVGTGATARPGPQGQG